MKYEIVLQGGFANQLFQLANAINVHPKHDEAKFIINISNYESYFRSEYITKLFPGLIEDVINTPRNFRWLRVKDLIQADFCLIREDSPFSRKPVPCNMMNASYVLQNGYFQNSNIAKVNGILFAGISGHAAATRFVGQHEVAIHIRRGDYLTNTTVDTPSDEYYLNAVDLIRNQFDTPEFTVFSDDIKYAYKLFENVDIKEYVDPTRSTDVHDFAFMSKFQKYIISNSSYSYAASLMQSKPDIVVSPEMWTKKHSTLTTDLVHEKLFCLIL